MKKVLFASDIDNTLMFSHRHKLEGDVCIEHLEGREQGFVTPRTQAQLAEINARCLFVPLTTRSVAQYRRIKWPEGCTSKYAVTANGGILLADDEVDTEWLRESRAIVAPWQTELERMLGCLETAGMSRVQAIVDEMFLFAACNDAAEAMALKARFDEETSLTVELTGRKVYFFPPPLHKGAALQRLQRRFSPDLTISAGDSEIDVPMLQAADIAIAPAALAVAERGNRLHRQEDGQRFADYILETVLREAAESEVE